MGFFRFFDEVSGETDRLLSDLQAFAEGHVFHIDMQARLRDWRHVGLFCAGKLGALLFQGLLPVWLQLARQAASLQSGPGQSAAHWHF